MQVGTSSPLPEPPSLSGTFGAPSHPTKSAPRPPRFRGDPGTAHRFAPGAGFWGLGKINSHTGRSPCLRRPGLYSSFGEAQGPLAHDVALDLAGAGVDRARPAAQERGLPAVRRVAVALGPDQRLRAQDVHRDLAQPAVVLAPEQLVDRRLGAGLAPGGQAGQGAQALVPHDLDVAVRPGQLLADERVLVAAALARRGDQLPELALEAQVLGRGAAAPLVAERG